MSSRGINYGELHSYLCSLGYRRKTAPTHVVYEKIGKELPVILPKVSKKEPVRLSHLATVEQILVLDGVIKKGQLAYSIGRASARQALGKPSIKIVAVELADLEALPAKVQKKVKIVRSGSSCAAKTATVFEMLTESTAAPKRRAAAAHLTNALIPKTRRQKV